MLSGGLGNDSLDGDAGLDLADYAAGAAVAVDLSVATDRATRGAEIDTLGEIEGAIGSANADTFRGDARRQPVPRPGRQGHHDRRRAARTCSTSTPTSRQPGRAPTATSVTDFAHRQRRPRPLHHRRPQRPRRRSTTPSPSSPRAGAAFTGAGQVRWYQSGGNTFVEANVDANLAPDLQIQLDGLKTLTAGDFVL